MVDILISQIPVATEALSRSDLMEVEQGVDPDNTSGHIDLGELSDFLKVDLGIGSPVTALTSVAGVVTIDCSLGKDFTITLDEDVTSVVLTDLAGAGFATEIELVITEDGTGDWTFALPSAFKALGGSDTAIATAAGAVTVLAAKTVDNGTTWRYAMQESA